MTKRTTLIGIGLAVLATLIWSGNFIVARGVINDIPPITLAFYRWLLATLILLPFAWKYFSSVLTVVKDNWLYFLAAAATGVSVFNTFVYIGGHYSDAINLALIGTTTSPIISVILARIVLKEKISLFRLLGMMICVAGIFLLLSKGSLAKLYSLSFSKGDWWVLGAALSFAIYNTLVRKKPAGMNPIGFLFIIFVLGTVLLAPFYLNEIAQGKRMEFTVTNLAVILYLGLGASVICFLLWNIAIGKLGSGRTALFGNLIPVFSSIEAVLILGEKI
ncbi:MAG TPA: DMT family transporter, partial [Chitinophagaceae bacterium]|nr:DMT family transporter [Chitinophagaceae bacterium]